MRVQPAQDSGIHVLRGVDAEDEIDVAVIAGEAL
jgi:hypothetical protein